MAWIEMIIYCGLSLIDSGMYYILYNFIATELNIPNLSFKAIIALTILIKMLNGELDEMIYSAFYKNKEGENTNEIQ